MNADHRISPAALAAVLALSAVAADGPLRLLRITPSGTDVPPGHEIVLQFDRPVVPVGRMERAASEVPVTVEPDPGCRWRWLDVSALACRLPEDAALAPATTYRVVVGAGLEARDGSKLAEAIESSFTTARPHVVYVWFESWEAPGVPVIRIVFDQAVEPASAAAHLRFAVGDGAIGARLEPIDSEGEGRAWLVRPVAELPGDADVALRVEPGVRSTAGAEAGVEDREVVRFRTFPSPRFLGVSCRTNDGDPLRIAPGSPRGTARCNPLGGVALVFSSPVGPETLRDHLRVEPDLAGGREDLDPWADVRGYSMLEQPVLEDGYPVWLPVRLRAARTYRLAAAAAAIRDAFDRPLARDLALEFDTDHRPPDLRLLDDAAVLETAVDTHVPVAVTNLDRITADVRLWDGADTRAGRFVLAPPRAQDVAYLYPLRVREWLGGRSGAVVGRLAAEPSTREKPPWFFAEVTPFQVHVKLGHYGTLVWVTRLDDGAPVEGATVDVVERVYATLAGAAPPKAGAVTDGDGLARLPGADVLDPEGSVATWWRSRDETHLFVRVRLGDALALVPLASDFRIDARGPNGAWISIDREKVHGHLRAWGATAQGVYRAGDLVQYKVWVRNDGGRGLEPPPEGDWSLAVVDPMGREVETRSEVPLDRFGAFDGAFTVPRTGAVGWYRFELRSKLLGDRALVPIEVLVSDFTPAPFRVATDLDGELYRDGDDVAVTAAATLHAGGPYVDAAARVVARLRSAPFRTADPRAAGFEFDTGEVESETVHESDGRLDGEGVLRTTFPVRSDKVLYGDLAVESAVRDDRGKSIAATARARFAARDRFVGLRVPGWVLEAGKRAEAFALVSDAAGTLVDGAEVDFRIERLETVASRVKGPGNAYLTEYDHTWKELATCRATAAADAPANCPFVPPAAGTYRATATVADTRGRTISSRTERWAAGRGVVLWDDGSGTTLGIVPEKETLHVGDTARYLVRNPFPGARALVTIERYGVIDSWIETLTDSTAIVEFPVKPDYLPGFYLSILVTSPRVEAPPPAAAGDVDLGKPAFRLGYVRVPVRDAYKELDVEVSPERAEYRPRERARVQIRVRTRQGEVPDASLAVTVLDESVLDLLARGTGAFDPYAGMYDFGSLDLFNYNLLKNLVGIRKFEAKGANPGGGGGLDPALRSQFKFVSTWVPALATDANGEATLEFELPDNLTAWRVLVMAGDPAERFGLGQATFRVNLPTEIRPALPNQVAAGDRFDARFTVMNRTDAPRTLAVEAEARGAVRGRPATRETLVVEPYKRRLVTLPVEAAGPGTIRFRVRAGSGADGDALETSLEARRRIALVTAATYGTTTDDEVVERVAYPADALGDAGGVAVTASPTVLGELEGAFAWIRDYPYPCWEQQITQAVMAAQYVRLRSYLAEGFEWPNAETIPDAVMARAADYQAPNGGMAFWIPDDAYVSPYLSAYTALAFGWLRDAGREVPEGVESRLHGYLETLLRRDAFPTFYSKGMASSVRAVALAALARAGKVGVDDVLRYRPHVPRMDLFGKAHWLQALARVGGPEAVRRETLDAILAAADESGGKLAFVETLDDGYTRMLWSETRTSCAVLDALAAEGSARLDAAGAGALPFKIVRSVTATRGARTHWENTQENAFCAAALATYAATYEAERPDFEVAVRLGRKKLGTARISGVRAAPATFERAMRKGDPGRDVPVRIERRGTGRMYWNVRLTYAPRDFPAAPTVAGLEIRREYSVRRDGRFVKLGEPAEIRRGDLVRVDLYLFAPGPRNFVVVDDPVPGGLEPVDRALATSSDVDADLGDEALPPDSWFFRYDDWTAYGVSRWSFYHRELRHDAARFYADWLPAGRYHLAYVAQAVASGTFLAPPPRAEEMYDPDVFGLGVPGTLRVAEGAP